MWLSKSIGCQWKQLNINVFAYSLFSEYKVTSSFENHVFTLWPLTQCDLWLCPAGSSVTQLKASDPEGEPLVYGVSGEEAMRYFSVNSVTGVVWLRQQLDREVRPPQHTHKWPKHYSQKRTSLGKRRWKVNDQMMKEQWKVQYSWAGMEKKGFWVQKEVSFFFSVLLSCATCPCNVYADVCLCLH